MNQMAYRSGPDTAAARFIVVVGESMGDIAAIDSYTKVKPDLSSV